MRRCEEEGGGLLAMQLCCKTGGTPIVGTVLREKMGLYYFVTEIPKPYFNDMR